MKRHYRPLPTQERLQELFDYSVTTGTLYHRQGPRKGLPAGYAQRLPSGQVRHAISISGTRFYAYRLIWKWITGTDPDQRIDHADGDHTNNAWHNLRLATQAQNMANSRLHITSKSGFKGVSWHKAAGRWVAQITHNYENHYLGLYDTPEEAHAVYVEAAHRLKGEFARAA